MSSLVTDIGAAKLLSATPLAPVTISKVFIGSGSGSFDSSIMALKNKVWEGPASAPIKDGNKLAFTCYIPANVGGWNITEWGLVDITGDLIAYGQLDNPINKTAGTIIIEPYFYIQLSSESETQLIVTDSVNFNHAALTNRSAADSHPISSITGLTAHVNDAVMKTGDQTITGKKTFTGSIENSIPGGWKYIRNTSATAVKDSAQDETGYEWGHTQYYFGGSKWFSDTVGIELKVSNNQIIFNGRLVGDATLLSKASKTAQGVMRVGDNLNVTDGIVTPQLATVAQKGIVQVGANINIIDTVISVNDATASQKGVVRIGNNIDIDSSSIISVKDASTTQKGAVIIGNNIDVNNGLISVKDGTTSQKGVLQVGTNIDVISSVISIKDGSTSDKGVVKLATQGEAEAGTSSTSVLTPATLRNSLKASGTAPIFGCRAFCNFNGTNGSIRKHGNIFSVTRTGTGVYNVVFSMSMPDANYAVVTSQTGQAAATALTIGAQTTSGFTLYANFGGDNTAGAYDPEICCFSVFG